MKNMQKLNSKAQAKLTLRNAVIFLFGGLGVLFVLFLAGFLLYNLGSSEKSIAAGSISSVKTGMWVENRTWNLHRKPIDNEEIVIAQKEEVTVTHNISLRNVTIKVYGTLKLNNANLKLDERSTILIAKTGRIVNAGHSATMLRIGSHTWLGDEVDAIGAPGQLTSSGLTSVDLLPVTLSYFKGTSTDNHSVILEWATQSELNNAYFTIEKKIGDSNFILVDTLRGAGNSNSEIKYSYEDKHVFASSVYYRLKQTDLDGNFKYFNIINVTTDQLGQATTPGVQIKTAGPNPFTDKFILLYNSSGNSNVELKISAMDGKVVHQERLAPIDGENEYTLPETVSMKKGVYIVALLQNGRSDSVKMIKK